MCLATSGVVLIVTLAASTKGQVHLHPPPLVDQVWMEATSRFSPRATVRRESSGHCLGTIHLSSHDSAGGAAENRKALRLVQERENFRNRSLVCQGAAASANIRNTKGHGAAPGVPGCRTASAGAGRGATRRDAESGSWGCSSHCMGIPVSITTLSRRRKQPTEAAGTRLRSHSLRNMPVGKDEEGRAARKTTPGNS